MADWKKMQLYESSSVRDVMNTINKESCSFIVITDVRNTLQGTITDGDIRRGILRGVDIDGPATEVMNRKPRFFLESESNHEILTKIKEYQVRYAPIVNSKNEVIGVKSLQELSKTPSFTNKVVIMAGGLGSRLGDLTKKYPKPMLNVGGKPILETIISNFTNSGFKNISLSVNYLGEVIEDYFSDGQKFNAKIDYLKEPKKLGTAGSLTLLKNRGDRALLVMNGDILTNVNFEDLLQFHNENSNVITMCVRKHKYTVPYGVVQMDEGKVVRLKEKPEETYFVNAGIYIINPDVIDAIPEDEYFDMTMLISKLIESNQNIGAFPLHEYWMDIGQKDDFFKAGDDYGEIFE
jgi:dTDP-glucose pyrophosphorylase